MNPDKYKAAQATWEGHLMAFGWGHDNSEAARRMQAYEAGLTWNQYLSRHPELWAEERMTPIPAAPKAVMISNPDAGMGDALRRFNGSVMQPVAEDYARGPSSWGAAAIVVYPDGRRVMVSHEPKDRK